MTKRPTGHVLDRRESAVAQTHTEEFLHAFADVERQLKRRLKLKDDDRTAVVKLIDDYIHLNPLWTDDGAKVRQFCSIRNLLAHERSAEGGYPILVTAQGFDRLKAVLSRLSHPEKVSSRYHRPVETVGLGDPLSGVLQRVYEREISQFPVIDRARFRGLVTENGVTRWMGRHVKHRGSNVDLQSVTVRDVLEEEEAEVGRQGNVFAFVSAESPVDEVMGKFANGPMLEAVLITETGRGGTQPLLGIVTQWDASRYPGRHL